MYLMTGVPSNYLHQPAQLHFRNKSFQNGKNCNIKSIRISKKINKLILNQLNDRTNNFFSFFFFYYSSN